MSDDPPRRFEDVPGWLIPTDQLLFEWILTLQNRTQPPGDLVELGVYKGKSAIHIARFKRDEEKFTV